MNILTPIGKALVMLVLASRRGGDDTTWKPITKTSPHKALYLLTIYELQFRNISLCLCNSLFYNDGYSPRRHA